MEAGRRPFDVIEHFRQAAKAVSLPAGVELFRSGDPGDVMYVVMEGYANILVGSKIVEIAGPGFRVTANAARSMEESVPPAGAPSPRPMRAMSRSM